MTTTSIPTTTTTPDPRAVAARTIGLALDCVRFGERRQGDLSSVTVDADKDLLNLGKHLVPRRQRRAQAVAIPKAAKDAANALRAIERIDFGAQEWLKTVGLPSFFKPGTHRLPLAMVEEVEQKMTDFLKLRGPAIDKFCALYPDLIEAMREPLGSQYRREDYPPVEDVRARFSFEWRWFELDGVPDRLDAVSTAAYRAAKKRLDQNMAEVVDGLRTALREFLRGIVAELTKKLAGEGDEAPKQFRQSTVLNDLSEFFRTFPLRNVTDDAALADVVAQLRLLTSNVDLDEVKTDADLQKALRADLEKAKGALDDLLIERGARFIEL